MKDAASSTIAVIGGTGALGSAIALRLAKAGRTVIIGSRSANSAEATAEQLGFGIKGSDLSNAAASADVVIVAVPFSAQSTTLVDIAPHVQGKIVVDTTVPLVPPRVMRVQLPAAGSAAVHAQGLLGESVRLVSAFHNVAAHKLIKDEPVDCDVLVFGDDKAARTVVIGLVGDCGLRGIHAGALVNSAAAEALTSVLIFINKAYAVDGAGIAVTGSLIDPAI